MTPYMTNMCHLAIFNMSRWAISGNKLLHAAITSTTAYLFMITTSYEITIQSFVQWLHSFRNAIFRHILTDINHAHRHVKKQSAYVGLIYIYFDNECVHVQDAHKVCLQPPSILGMNNICKVVSLIAIVVFSCFFPRWSAQN